MSARSLTRKLIALGVLLSVTHDPTLASAATGGPTSGTSGGADGATFWVVTATEGGVGRPAGASTCSGWNQTGPLTTGGPFPDADLIRTTPDGVVWISYFRICEGIPQFAWVPDLPGVDLARSAYDEAVGRVEAPAPEFFPLAEYGIVGAETLFGAEPQAAQSVTARIPGLSATVTATPVLLRLETGSRVAGDVAVVECAPWGSAVVATGGCVWSPVWPSVSEVTGTDDYRYHATVSVVWEVTWTSSDGTSGVFDDLVVSTPVLLAVREVQTF